MSTVLQIPTAQGKWGVRVCVWGVSLKAGIIPGEIELEHGQLQSQGWNSEFLGFHRWNEQWRCSHKMCTAFHHSKVSHPLTSPLCWCFDAPPPYPYTQCETWDWSGTHSNTFLRQRRRYHLWCGLKILNEFPVYPILVTHLSTVFANIFLWNCFFHVSSDVYWQSCSVLLLSLCGPICDTLLYLLKYHSSFCLDFCFAGVWPGLLMLFPALFWDKVFLCSQTLNLCVSATRVLGLSTFVTIPTCFSFL